MEHPVYPCNAESRLPSNHYVSSELILTKVNFMSEASAMTSPEGRQMDFFTTVCPIPVIGISKLETRVSGDQCVIYVEPVEIIKRVSHGLQQKSKKQKQTY